MRRFAEAKSTRVVIAEEEGSLVGFVILNVEHDHHETVGYVVTLDVAPEQRRRGVAGSLMREVERKAADEGCAAMVLHVFAGNDTATKFYAAMGYVRSQRVEGFYGPGLDAWLCHKPLRTADC